MMSDDVGAYIRYSPKYAENLDLCTLHSPSHCKAAKDQDETKLISRGNVFQVIVTFFNYGSSTYFLDWVYEAEKYLQC